MKYNNDLNYEYVNSVLRYVPITGHIFWKSDRPNRPNGSRAGTVQNQGYIGVFIKNKAYKAHRIAWLLMTKKWPKECIDHINGNTGDNRWCNLREASHGQNQKNRRTGNKSGYKGVYKNKFDGKWLAVPRLGPYETKEEAAKIYNEIMAKYSDEFAYINDIYAGKTITFSEN